MKDFHERLEKFQIAAEDCALIAKLASSAEKRATFARIADQLRTMAADIEATITAKP